MDNITTEIYLNKNQVYTLFSKSKHWGGKKVFFDVA